MSSAPKGERRRLDAYYTPDDLARRLVGALPIQDGASVAEMHVGGGAFTLAVRAKVPGASIHGNDVDPDAWGLKECESSRVGDALTMSGRYDWVIGNPPYRGFADHVDRALTLAPNVAFLLRLAATESKSRVPCWQRWPLRKVWVMAERPSFTGGKTDSCAYGWFWFDRGHEGPAEIVPGWSWK